jgi:hypothetical protein
MGWREDDFGMQKRFMDACNVWFKNDQNAIRCAVDIVYIAHLWDDLVDRDRERTSHEISYAFKAALFHLMENPFYVRNIGELKPVMVNAYLNWQGSSRIKSKAKRWFLKASIYNIMVHIAYVVGGMEWGEQMAPKIWDFYEEDIENA